MSRDHAMAGRKVVDVVAAVILQPDGRFLLARRPEGKPYAGYWEFPGGKVEVGETLLHALARELHEELGIGVERADPWLVRHFDYAHARVKLHFFRVSAWHDDPHGREGQALSWQLPGQVDVAPLLPANGPILRALDLPAVYAISNIAEMGEAVFLHGLDAQLAKGLRLVQLREKQLCAAEFGRVARRVVEKAHASDAKVVVNGDAKSAAEAGADGVHLTSAALMGCRERPPFDLCGASCHTAAELTQAVDLGLDYVLLGPVLPTLSHPGSAVLGWEGFAALITDYPLPVYALGGMDMDCMDSARRHGAHGIAMLRGVW